MSSESDTSPSDTSPTCELFPYELNVQELCEECVQANDEGEGAVDYFVPACFNVEGTSVPSVDVRGKVSFQELTYPGRATGRAPVGAYVYVFQDDAAIREVKILSETSYQVKDLTQKNAAPYTTAGTLELDEASISEGRPYSFFLSPFSLGQRSIDLLLSHDDRSTFFYDPPTLNSQEPLPVVDIVRWTLEVHEKVFFKRLKTYQAWFSDEERNAKLFVASTLHAWEEQDIVDEDNTFGWTNEMREGQPKVWLDDYTAEKSRLTKEADEGAAHVAQLATSIPFKAIEMAAIDTGGEAVARMLLAWAGLSPGLLLVKSGRVAVADLLEQEDRILRTHVFSEAQPANPVDFAEYRFAWNAVMGIYADFIPAVITSFLAAEPDKRSKVLAYLQAKGAKVELKGLERVVEKNLEQGKRPLKMSRRNKSKRRNYQKEYQKIVAHADKAHISKGKEAAGQTLSRAYRGIDVRLGKGLTVLSGALEVTNLALAMDDLVKGEGGTDKALSAIGASADLGAFISDLIKGATKSNTILRWAGRLAGSFTIVASVMDGIAFYSEMTTAASSRRNYAEAIGNGVALIGTGLTFFSGGLALAASLGVGTLAAGPAGWIALVIGLVLIGVGSLASALFSRDPYEEFGIFSFLGKKYNDSGMSPFWSPLRLPASPKEQAKVLLCLMANFSVRVTREGLGLRVNVSFGYAGADSTFILEISRVGFMGKYHESIKLAARPVAAEMKILSSTELIVDGENMIEATKSGRLTGFFFTLQPTSAPSSVLSYYKVLVNAQHKYGAGESTPAKGQHLVFSNSYEHASHLTPDGVMIPHSLSSQEILTSFDASGNSLDKDKLKKAPGVLQ